MTQELLFGKAVIHNRDKIYVYGSLKDDDEKDIWRSYVLQWADGKWSHWQIDTRVAAITSFENRNGINVLSMGIDGTIHVADGQGFHVEMVDSSDAGPSKLRNLTTMRVIGDYVYVAGMSRQIYRRSLNGGKWARADNGILVDRGSTEIAGIKAIDGFAESDIYAVGFRGEIWHFNGTAWSKLDSPTNVKLENVKAVAPEHVYICGAKGIVLSGNKSGWEIVNNEATNQTLWSLEYFDNVIYLSTNKGEILKIMGDEVVFESINLKDNVSTYWLHSKDGIMISVGARDILRFDGQKWEEIAHP